MSDLSEDKKLVWEQTVDKFRKQTDGLGKLLDEEIFDTVVALNVLGISTSASCEGHIDWGEAGPWVDIQPTETEKEKNLYKKRAALEQQIQEKERNGKKPMDLEKDWVNFHKINAQISKPCLVLIQKMLVFLGEFYKSRNVTVERGLVMYMLGLRIARIESQGVIVQPNNHIETRRVKLAEYQEEMRDFTIFLKKKFFEV